MDYQGYSVELNGEDINSIEDIASRRGKAQREIGGEKIDPHKSFGDINTKPLMDYIGAIGEYSFSKFHHLEPPYVSDKRLSKGDRGYDFSVEHIPSGELYTIEVKSTDNVDGNLLVRKDEDIIADVYILCIVRDRKVYIVGGQTSKFIKSKDITSAGMKFPCRVVRREELLLPPSKDEIRKIRESEITLSKIGEDRKEIVKSGDILDVEDYHVMRVEEIY